MGKHKLPLWLLALIIWIPYKIVEWTIRKLRPSVDTFKDCG